MTPGESWTALFFTGRRLEAEVSLHAERFLEDSAGGMEVQLALAHINRARGACVSESHIPPPQFQVDYQDAGDSADALKVLVQQEPDYPDPLLLWALRTVLPVSCNHAERRAVLRRVGLLLSRRFPQRLDLFLVLTQEEPAAYLLRSLPDRVLQAAEYYSNPQVAMMQLQSLWAKGLYAQMLLAYLNYQLYHRWFPGSDYVLRAYSSIGLADRVDLLFRDIYSRHEAELTPATISNMLFTALGLDRVEQAYVARLVGHWRRLTRPVQLLPQRLTIRERPNVVVVSADLRMHPVGRFWLPLLQRVRRDFRVEHVVLNPYEQDPVRDQICSASDAWHLLESQDEQDVDALLRRIQPDVLLDLGGHTADNRPGLLNQRYAPVQATYLGFYGPSYGEQCDWWVLDATIARRVRDSYPGSEPVWELPGPSLCYDVGSHGLPVKESIVYSEPDHPVIGSFNHTRKITRACIDRFAAVLEGMPEAVLQFRSHSFADPSVRRWFLRQFLDAGIAPEQLQPLPYAPTPWQALKDYGRIHLHVDSYPVSGTTTTLDALAMGIPVLTCPNHLYAGAISAAILEQVGLEEMVCDHPRDLSAKARDLCRQYASAAARRQLAERVRSSAVCDTTAMPAMFAEQLGLMLRRVSN